MKAIQKQSEPQSLAQHRASSSVDYVADYDNYQNKDDLRQSLVAEQGGICCYCMQRIRPNADDMKIEHWRCQQDFSGEQLDYANLLGACCGGEGQPPVRQHCDTRKGDQPLSKNPANPAHHIEQFIRFLGDGTVESDDATLNDELNNVLNLNLSQLQRNRKSVLDSFVKSVSGRQGVFRRELLERWITEWCGDDGQQRREYCLVVVYWLRKKLARLNR